MDCYLNILLENNKISCVLFARMLVAFILPFFSEKLLAPLAPTFLLRNFIVNQDKRKHLCCDLNISFSSSLFYYIILFRLCQIFLLRLFYQAYSFAVLLFCSPRLFKYEVLQRFSSKLPIFQIKYLQARDSGMYECQVSTQPVRSFFVRLNILGEQNTAHTSSINYIKTSSSSSYLDKHSQNLCVHHKDEH